MIPREDAIEFLRKMREFKPARLFNKVDESTAGMRFVMVYLREHDKDVYASTIAKDLGISRARMGVLLQKLVGKGLVEKVVSRTDGRIEVLRLTPQGKKEIHDVREKMIDNVERVIEEIGLEELNQFIETSAKIKMILDDME